MQTSPSFGTAARYYSCMADLEQVLRDAREKTAAEKQAGHLRKRLAQLDAELVELEAVRTEIAKSGGVRGMLRRNRTDPQQDEVELNRIRSTIAALEMSQASDQQRLRTYVEQSQGAELARATLGAEMKRRTAALSPDDPGRARLVEIDTQREAVMQRRNLATEVSTLAAELVSWVDGAEQADDGTDYMYVELQSASLKREQLQSFLSEDAAIARAMLKDQLEAFRTINGGTEAYLSVRELASLILDDQGDHRAWLHRVRGALKDTVEAGTADEQNLRGELVDLDNERLQILTN